MILFTDGKHDVKGVPVSRVQPDARSAVRGPLAVRPAARRHGPRAEGAGRARGRARRGCKIIRDMPACVSGATFDWPQVVFQTADAGGQRRRGRAPGRHLHVHRRADARRRRPAPTPRRGPRHPAHAGRRPDRARLDARGSTPVAGAAPPIIDYTVRCRPGERRLDRVDRGHVARAEGDRRGADQRDVVRLRGRRRRRDGGRRVDPGRRLGHADRPTAGARRSRGRGAQRRPLRISSRPRPAARLPVPLRVLAATTARPGRRRSTSAPDTTPTAIGNLRTA